MGHTVDIVLYTSGFHSLWYLRPQSFWPLAIVAKVELTVVARLWAIV